MVGQTTVDLARQGRNLDFTQSGSTRPVQVGTVLPPVCEIGELFFKEGGTHVLYACTAPNLWVLQGGGGVIASGTGLLMSNASGTIENRAITAAPGLTVSDGAGLSGNPRIAPDVATLDEATAGITGSKLMTPDRVRSAFTSWNPLPPVAGKAFGLMTTNGVTSQWSWKLTLPAGGVQDLDNAGARINANRTFVKINPRSDLTLTGSPVIADGEDGQFLTLTNISGGKTLTLCDESACSGSNLKLGQSHLTLGSMESVSLIFAAEPSAWLVTTKGGQSLPSAGGQAFGLLTTNGVSNQWSWKLTLPAGDVQNVSNAGMQISASRTFVKVAPESDLTLTGSPVIADGEDGQFLTLTNISGAKTLTLCDESACPGSNLRLGRTHLALGPMDSVSLVFAAEPSAWLVTSKAEPPALPAPQGIAGPQSPTPGQIAVFTDSTGKALGTLSGSGILKSTGGVASVVNGTSADLVRADGTASPLTLMQYVYAPVAGLENSGAVRIGPGWTTPSGASNGAMVSLHQSTGHGIGYLSFPAGGTYTAWYRTTIPDNWAGGPVSAELDVAPTSGCSSGQSFSVAVSTRTWAPGDNMFASYTGFNTVTPSPVTLPSNGFISGSLNVKTFDELPTDGWVAGRRVIFQIRRLPDAATCSMTLFGLKIGWKVTAQ